MREKTADFFYAFCVSTGGMCIALLYRVDLLMAGAVFAASFVFSLLCTKIVFPDSRTVKIFHTIGAVISASVSVYIGTTLATDFALDNSFIPICILLSCAVVFGLSVSASRAAKAVASVMSVICLLLLLVIFLLCVLESDFTWNMSISADKKILFPLIAFSVLDNAFVMSAVKKQNRKYFLFGSVTMPLYILLTCVLTVSALSPEIFSKLDNPIITLWHTCYVLSFVDRFETLIICVLYMLCIVKAGILLKSVRCTCKKTCFAVFVILVLPLVFLPSLLYAYALVSAACAVVFTLLKKCY